MFSKINNSLFAITLTSLVCIAPAFADTLEDARLKLSQVEAQAMGKVNTENEMPTLEQTERDSLQFANELFLMFAGRDCHSKALHNGAVGGSGLREDVHNCTVEKLNARISEVKARYGL